MSTWLPRSVRRFAQPRSRRSQLWACVYCGAFRPEEPNGSDADLTTPVD